MTSAPTFAILGDTDTASALTAALAATGITMVTDLAEVDVVFVAVSPILATQTARTSADALKAGAVYVDFSAGTPGAKRTLAALFAAETYADAALTVIDSGIEIAASGDGASRLEDALRGIIDIDVISATVGAAATRTLLRSLLDNGMANVLVDTLWAAESLGQADWMHREILRAFGASTGESAQKLLADASVNFKRRQMDMQDVVELLGESGFESTMLAPIQFTHGRIMHSKKIPHAKG